MKTINTTQLVTVTVAAFVALAALAQPIAAHAETVVVLDRVGAYYVVVNHQGPGLGSVKAPPFVHESFEPKQVMQFHVDQTTTAPTVQPQHIVNNKSNGVH